MKLGIRLDKLAFLRVRVNNIFYVLVRALRPSKIIGDFTKSNLYM